MFWGKRPKMSMGESDEAKLCLLPCKGKNPLSPLLGLLIETLILGKSSLASLEPGWLLRRKSLVMLM